MKKVLLSLFVGFVGIISFCSADYITNYTVVNNNGGSSQSNFLLSGINNGASVVFENYIPGSKPAISISCNNLCTAILPDGSSIRFNYVDLRTFSYYGSIINFNHSLCDNSCRIYMYPGASLSYSILSGVQYPSSSSSCPEVDTGAILSGYVPESDLLTCQSSLSGCQSSLNTCQSDYNTCQSNTSGFNNLLNNCSNNLNACNTSLSSCLSNNCPVSSGGINWSSLFINGLQHNSAPYISVSIPEEIAWDYTSTDEEFDLTVSGYNVDTDYIAGIIVNQNSKPSQDDLNKLISEVLPLFIPGLVVIIFLYFIFRFIKKIF